MPIAKRKAANGLKRKGFREEPGSNHRVFVHYYDGDGPSMARTLMSHGSRPKDLSDGRIAQMARQCHLSKQQFLALIECTLTRESYERHLRKAATSS